MYNYFMKKSDDIHKYIWIEFAIWFFILCITVAGIRIHRHNKAKELVTYQLFMPDVDGVIVGSPVKFMGVQVGYIDKVKIVSNEVYLKVVITEKDVTLPKGSVATVEFSGMGGSKSLEIYPPTEESLASKKIIAVQPPKRLHDSLGLLNDMFDKLGSITSRMSFFANEVGVSDKGLELDGIQENMNMLDKWVKVYKEDKKMEKVRVISNPVINLNLCTMRDKDTDSQGVRIATRKITRCLLYEASKNLPLVDTEITTPLTTFTAKTVDPDINLIISPILRAGLIFTDEAIDILPQATIRHIGMYRDEETLKPVWYYNKVPMEAPNPEKFYIYITDPMLATGNSLIEAIKLYADKGIPIENIKVICIIAAPQGIENIHRHYPDIEIITAAVDKCLNEKGYIVPGMGDAGDRIFNTI